MRALRRWLDRTIGRALGAAATASPPWHILTTLTALLEHGFVVAETGPDGEPRFRMLDTMREYALERLHASSSHRLRTELAFVRYFGTLVRDASAACESGSAPWPTEFVRAETPNLKVALGLAVERFQSSDAQTIATVWSIWETQSDLERGRQLAREAVRLKGARDDADGLRLRARVQRTVGILALGCHDIDEGRRALESARELVQTLGDLRGNAIAECDLAYLTYQSGDDKACGSYANLALAYFKAIDPVPQRELGWVYAYLALGEYDETNSRSDDLCDAALAYAREANDARLLAFVYHFQGLLAFRARDLATAEDKFRESIRSIGGSETSIAYDSLSGLGIVAGASGHLARAVSLIVAADRGLAGVTDSGTTLRQLKIAADASMAAISSGVGADAVAAWTQAARAVDVHALLRHERTARRGSA